MMLFSPFIWLFYIILFNTVLGQNDTCPDESTDFYNAQVIYFYAPYLTSDVKGQIVIYFNNQNFKYGDTVVLVEDNTTQSLDTNYYYYPIATMGLINTRIKVKDISQSVNSSYQHECLGYSGGWMRDGVDMTTSCLSTHPDWMYQQKDSLQNRRLISLMIPGTHNSGSYSKTLSQSTFEKFAVTQNKDVLEQLISGVRYLDFRPCIDDEYWICHGNYFMNPLTKIIDDIKNFMKNTEEIVILSFKEFSVGFKNDSDHLDFIAYLIREFAEYIFPQSFTKWRVMLRRLWKSGKRLIISYSHRAALNNSTVWPAIPQMWGNIPPLGDLKEFLREAESSPIQPRATMAEITLDAWTVTIHSIADVFHINHMSLRDMASAVGPSVTQWYNELFYRNASIVAVDYLDTTGIVDVAIYWNIRRSSQCYLNYTSAP